MRAGIAFMPQRNPPPGRQSVPPGSTFHSFPLEYDDRVFIAQARGIIGYKRIAVGETWFRLDFDEQDAVLLHELYHLRMFHMEQRILTLPLFATKWARERARKQEFAADEFAARRGYGVEFLRVLSRYPMRSEFHPEPADRMNRLTDLILGSVYEQSAA